MRGKKSTWFGYDADAIDAANGYMHGFSTEVKTDKYVTAAVNYAYEELSKDFEFAMDAIAFQFPKNFSHVYEWGNDYEGRYENVGNPARRLWALVSSQGGASRAMTFTFLPSIVPTPVNPILLEPRKPGGRTVKQGVHVFTWKAQVLEYGTPVKIKPRWAKAIAFVGRDGKIKFSKEGIKIDNPGGGHNQNQFTSFFLGWWSTEALETFDKRVRPFLESNTINEARMNRVIRKYTRRTKEVSLVAHRPGGAAFRDAAKEAKKDMNNTAKQLRLETGRRRRRAIRGNQ